MATKRQKELRAQLVAALRSGKHKQGRNRLTSIDKKGREFDCCLGVACKVLGAKSKIVALDSFADGETLPGGGEIAKQREYAGGEAGVLPKHVMKAFGFKTRDGSYPGGDLTVLNDSGTSLRKIARIIEQEPEGLFES